MKRNKTATATLCERIDQTLYGLKFVTRCILVTSWMVCVIGIVFPSFLAFLALNVELGVNGVWKLLTTMFVHFNLLSCVLGILLLAPYANNHEKTVGTVQYACFILVVTMLTNILFYSLANLLKIHLFTHQINGLLPITFSEMAYCTTKSTKLFHAINIKVPSTYHPWLLLALLTFMSPSYFLNFLCGILAGYALSMLKSFTMIPEWAVRKIDQCAPAQMGFVTLCESKSDPSIINTQHIMHI